jgi:hypothetical protein
MPPREVVDRMQSENQIAFKEWAVVCAALAQGRQTLILRKGGIHEGREGFRVEHGEFWLFPTSFHQQREEIVRDAWPLLDQVDRDAKPDRVAMQMYAVVQEAHRLQDLAIVSRLSGQHIWSPRTVEQRFHYRSPGLFALVVRVYGRESPVEITVTDRMAGCKSWVDLPQPLATAGLLPVLDNHEFERQRSAIAAAIC